MKRHFSLKQEVRSVVDSAVAKVQFDLKKYIDKQLDVRFHDIADAVDLAETKLHNKQTISSDYDLSMYDISNEWLPYETANSNESELSAEDQLLNEQKNQIDLGVVTCNAPEPEKAYSECVVLALQNKIDELKEKLAKAESECNKQKQRADLAECKFWDAEAMTTSIDRDNSSPTGLELLKAARNVLREFEVKDFDVSRKYTDESYGCPKTIGSLVCDIDWYLKDIKDAGKATKAEPSGDAYLSKMFLKQCNELRAENMKLKEQLEIADKKNEKLVQLLQATSGIDNADRAEEAAPSDSQSTYIVFNRTLLTDFLKTTDIDTVIAHISISDVPTFAYVYDKLTSQLEERNVASYHDYYIIELPNKTEKQL